MRPSSRFKVLGLTALLVLLTFIGYQSTVAQEPQIIPLRLASGTFDPVAQTPPAGLPSSLFLNDDVAHDNYYLVQFTGPIREANKEALEALGGEILGYIPEYTFLVRLEGTTPTAVANLAAVRWVGPYQPAYRLAPALIGDVIAGGQTEPVDVIIVTFAGEDVDRVVSDLQALGGTALEVTQTDWKGKIRAQVAADQLASLAQLDGVQWIEPAPVWELHNNVAVDVMDVRDVWDTHGLFGAGQIVAVADTGLDQGSASPAILHDDFEDGSGVSRVLALYDRVGDGANDVNSGHGTHVAGSVLGNGVLSGSTPSSNTYPSTAYVGAAPEASLILQAIENNVSGSLSGLPADLNLLFSQVYGDGARIHTNSWGSSVNGTYSSSSQDVDEFTWDNPDFLILFSAGNDGEDEDSSGVTDLTSIGSPATSKNNLTVGASENYRPGLSTWADNINGLAVFSSRGYTLDGRVKPDIVAPGTYIASARSSVASGTGWGVIDANYMYMGGTSMATPLVAGSAAIVRQWFMEEQFHTPSSSLMKAILLNGAFDLYPGQFGVGATQEITMTRPSPQSGWGRIDLENALFPAAPRQTWWWDSTANVTGSVNPISTGETATYTFAITQTDPLSATLVWTDYPGSPAAAGGLVNDLDLQIEGPDGSLYYPNHANAGGASQHLFYESPNVFLLSPGAGNRRAVRFTPTSYPVTLETALMYLGSNSDSYPKSFTYEVYDDDGVGGLPGTLLASGTTSITEAGYHPIGLSHHGLTITSGDFYVGLVYPDSDLLLAASNQAPIDGRSYSNSGSWSGPNAIYDFTIQAVVREQTPATNYDRVNNVVGIDIPSPATGVYTLTVSGFNVPQGPQPYALVLSGVGRLLGTETVTHLIDGPGTYRLGNSGVSLTFNSEDIDSVSVTVYRDQFPTSNPGDQLVNRSYVITTSGGTGAFDANVTFSYEDAELNGNDESLLNMYRYNSGVWEPVTADSRDSINNTVTVNNVTAFSHWALGSGSTPTALTLSESGAATTGGTAIPVGIVILVLLTAAVVTMRRRQTMA